MPPNVDDSVKLAINEAIGGLKEWLTCKLDEQYERFSATFMSREAYDIAHQGLEERIEKLERWLFWAVTASIVGSLGAAFALGMELLKR